MLTLTGFLVILTSLLGLDAALLAGYCRMQDKRAKRQKRLAEEQPSQPAQTHETGRLWGRRKILQAIDPYLYGWMRYSTILLGRIPSHRIRNVLLRRVFCMKITPKTMVDGGCEFRSPWNIVADRCVISTYCILDGRHGIYIGEDVVFGSGVHIWTEEHNVDDPLFGVHAENSAPVTIGAHAWICSDSTILPGVTVGEGAVLASRACLTKDAEAFGVYGGVPAKKIRGRNAALAYRLRGKPTWHFF